MVGPWRLVGPGCFEVRGGPPVAASRTSECRRRQPRGVLCGYGSLRCPSPLMAVPFPVSSRGVQGPSRPVAGGGSAAECGYREDHDGNGRGPVSGICTNCGRGRNLNLDIEWLGWRRIGVLRARHGRTRRAGIRERLGSNSARARTWPVGPSKIPRRPARWPSPSASNRTMSLLVR